MVITPFISYIFIVPQWVAPFVHSSPIPTGRRVLWQALPTGQCRIVYGRNLTRYLPFVYFCVFTTHLTYQGCPLVFVLAPVLGAHRPVPGLTVLGLTAPFRITYHSTYLFAVYRVFDMPNPKYVPFRCISCLRHALAGAVPFSGSWFLRVWTP